MYRQRAFTLIELLIVIVIIAVLTLVASYSYQKSYRKISSHTLKAVLWQELARIEQYHSRFGTYAGSESILDTVVAGSHYPEYLILPGPASNEQQISLVAIPAINHDQPGMCLNSAHEFIANSATDCISPHALLPRQPCDFSSAIVRGCSGDDCTARVICGSCNGNCTWSYINGNCNGNCEHALISGRCNGNCRNVLVIK